MSLFLSSHDRELELLSAYLDNQLAQTERAKLERRLAAEPKLQATLDDLRSVKTSLASLPKVKPPRNFTLTPKMLKARGLATPARPLTRLLPVVNIATALATVLFAVIITADLGGGFNAAAPAQAPAAQVENFQVAEAPAAADAKTTESASLKAVTETPEAGVAVFAPPLESSVEPLTGAPVAGGGVGTTNTGPEAVPLDTTASVGETATPPEAVADSATLESPTPDSSQRVATVTETPEVESPVAIEEAVQPSFPVRTVELALGVLLIILITTSLALRRR